MNLKRNIFRQFAIIQIQKLAKQIHAVKTFMGNKIKQKTPVVEQDIIQLEEETQEKKMQYIHGREIENHRIQECKWINF